MGETISSRIASPGISEEGTETGGESSATEDPGKRVIFLPEPHYTSGRAARILGIPARTMRRFLAVGRIVGEKNPVTGTWQIPRDNLILFALESGFTVNEKPEIIRFLIIHHDPEIAHRLVDFLKSNVSSSRIEHTSDPCNGLLRLGDEPPDILFLSPTMPVLRGREMLCCLRAYPKTKNIKIIGVSSEQDCLAEFQRSGANGILATPYQNGQLLDLLKGILPRAAFPNDLAHQMSGAPRTLGLGAEDDVSGR